MHLYTAVMASAFGHGGRRPVRLAAIRLGMLGTAELAAGFALAQAVSNMPLAPLPYAPALLLSACITMQVVVLVCLLSAQGIIGRHAQDTFTRWLHGLPLRPLTRQLALLLPQMLLAALALTMVAWPLGLLFTALGASLWPCIGSFTAGAWSALGLARSSDLLHPVVRAILLGGLIYAEYSWISIVGSTTSTTSDKYVAQAAVSAILVISSLSLLRKQPSEVRPAASRAHGQWLPPAWWYLRKFIRSPSLGRSFGLTVCMSLGVVYACHKLHLQSSSLYGGAAALLGAAFCADIRSLARRNLPCEGGGIKGSLYVARQMLGSAVGCGLLAVSPLLWAGLQYGPTLDLVVVATAGCLAGAYASVAVAPAARDITGQWTATLLALGIVFGIPQLLPASVPLTMAYCILTGLLAAATLSTEYIRNRHYWRKYVHAFHIPRPAHHRNKY